LVFGTYNLVQPISRDQGLASKYIQGRSLETLAKCNQLIFSGAWAAFANDPHDGLSAYGWPVYDPHGQSSSIKGPEPTLMLCLDSSLANLALDNRYEPVFTDNPLGELFTSTN
jgi:hypothetical protein